MLDLTSLRKAIDSLERSVNAARAHMGTLDDDLRETVRAGVIQNFEVAYEQCWKFIRRWIRDNRTPEDADNPRTRRDLFRLAAQYGLVPDPTPWFEYGDARNLTSHTYNNEQAEVAYRVAQRFLEDAKVFLDRLERDD